MAYDLGAYSAFEVRADAVVCVYNAAEIGIAITASGVAGYSFSLGPWIRTEGRDEHDPIHAARSV